MCAHVIHALQQILHWQLNIEFLHGDHNYYTLCSAILFHVHFLHCGPNSNFNVIRFDVFISLSYNLANFELANDLLCDVDFDEILDCNDMQKSWIQFKAVSLHIMERCIPKLVLPQR